MSKFKYQKFKNNLSKSVDTFDIYILQFSQSYTSYSSHNP